MLLALFTVRRRYRGYLVITQDGTKQLASLCWNVLFDVENSHDSPGAGNHEISLYVAGLDAPHAVTNLCTQLFIPR